MSEKLIIICKEIRRKWKRRCEISTEKKQIGKKKNTPLRRWVAESVVRKWRRFSKLTVTLEKEYRWFSGFSEGTTADLVGSVMLGSGCENPQRRWGWKWKRQLRLGEREEWGIIHLILGIRFERESLAVAGVWKNFKAWFWE